MRRGLVWMRVAAVCLGLCACLRPTTVSRIGGVDFSNEDAREIFGEMSRVIAGRDGGADFACAEDFGRVLEQRPIGSLSAPERQRVEAEVARRGGRLGEAPQPLRYDLLGGVRTVGGPRAIMTQTDFRTVNAQPGFVKVVSGIFRCGATTLMTSATGCTGLGGFNSMVVIDRESSRDAGITWAHEYGHAVGLNHVQDPSRVMFARFSRSKRSVTLEECLAYSSPTDFDGPGGANGRRLAEPLDVSPPLEERPEGMSTEELVRTTHEHGIGYSIAEDLTRGDVPTLLRMLENPRDAEHRDKILALLGLIGGEGVADVLVEQVEAMRGGQVSWDRANELTSALLGLGALAHREQSAALVEQLQDWADPRIWTVEDEPLRDQIRLASMLAMAMSGRPGVGEALQRMRAETRDPAIASRMAEARAMFEKVQAEGLSAAMRGDR